MSVESVAAARFEKEARYAVGRALLKKFSRSGSGSSGRGIDEGRAAQLAERGVTGPELMDLLMSVAREASVNAQQELRDQRWSLIHEAERLAVESDSLSMHLFVQRMRPGGDVEPE